MDRVHHHCERKEGSDRVAESHFGVNLAPASELEARFLARALPADVRGVADENAIFPRGRGGTWGKAKSSFGFRGQFCVAGFLAQGRIVAKKK